MGNILWLASYPKSGNTWLRAFLANLIANRAAPLDLSELPQHCADEAAALRYSEAAGRPSVDLSVSELCALRPAVQASIAAQTRGTVLVKTHNFWGGFEQYPLHHPDLTAGGVYVLRNPLDVVVSMSHHFGLSMDAAIDYLGNEDTATDNEARWVTQLLGSWSTHVASWAGIDHPGFVVVRFEDLLDKPAKHFARIARLVGVSERSRIDRAIAHASFKSLSGNERRDGFIEASEKTTARFFRVGRAQQWRQVLSRDQVCRVIARHRELMARFKYLPAGYS
ncbi:MAG: sulfotransferase domain-containing protein [Lysobacterales bacterium]